MSPTQLTLRNLRERGFRAAVVEKWNPHAKIRQDLFGIIDVLGVREGQTIGVQCTTQAHRANRAKKMQESEAIADLRAAGWALEVHGWKKVEGKWQVVIEDISANSGKAYMVQGRGT